MKHIKLCKDHKLDAILKTTIIFVALIAIVLFILFLKDEYFNLKREIIHSIEIVTRILLIILVIDYIKIKKKGRK